MIKRILTSHLKFQLFIIILPEERQTLARAVTLGITKITLLPIKLIRYKFKVFVWNYSLTRRITLNAKMNFVGYLIVLALRSKLDTIKYKHRLQSTIEDSAST